ncbi:MAG: DsbA family protein [Granulosicoccus sp.]|nr:DsbA family protein [Granulosicoccus sp.]
MKSIPADTKHEEVIHPKPEHLASALGNHGVDVVSTPSMILFFEAASNNLAAGYYENNEVSVGTHVKVDHLAPAQGDLPIFVEAVLTLQKGRRLEFALTAYQGETLIMQGVHHRAVMPRAEFSQKANATGTQKTLEFWFDFHSPWCYFASHQIGEIAREANVNLIWKPVHLANLNAAVDGRRPLESNPNFVAWYQQDIADTAEQMQLPIAQHPNYPLGPSRALRAAIFAEEQGLAEPYVSAIMRGYWSQEKNITDLAWLSEVAVGVGMDGSAIALATKDPIYKQKLNENLQRAIDIRLFGLPVVYVDEKIFWGNDRLPLLRAWLKTRESNGSSAPTH